MSATNWKKIVQNSILQNYFFLTSPSFVLNTVLENKVQAVTAAHFKLKSDAAAPPPHVMF